MSRKNNYNCVEDIVESADNWRKAAYCINNEKDALELESNILLLFSSELYLKAILIMEGKAYKKNHSLYKMFHSIDGNKQKQLKKNIIVDSREYIDLAGEVHDFSDFDKSLKYISNGFVKYRYGFEIIMKNKGFIVLPDFIREYNDELECMVKKELKVIDKTIKEKK